MPYVVVSPLNGKYLDQLRGMSRGETPDLDRAGIFESKGKAKVAYNHAWSAYRYQNDYTRARLAQGHQAGPLYDIPEFKTQEVQIVLVGDLE